MAHPQDNSSTQDELQTNSDDPATAASDSESAGDALPGGDLDPAKMPGHWLLAQLGKKVLRPGGRELTTRLLTSLDLRSDDRVVELAPGLGATATMALQSQPASYTGIERDEAAARMVQAVLDDSRYSCVVGTAQQTGLADEDATVVYAEALLSMQSEANKRGIISEAFRVLKPGGRYGIHELSVTPDDLDEAVRHEINGEMTRAIHVGVRPLTGAEWRELLESEGFEVADEHRADMHLLEPRRVIQDEGFVNTARILFNVLRKPAARKRVLAMRKVFRHHAKHLGAVAIVATKPPAQSG